MLSVEVPAWATIVVGGILGVGAVVAALVRLVPQLRELYVRARSAFRAIDAEAQAKADLRASLLTVRRVTAIKAVLDRWVLRKGAQRCLLLTANNGGTEWKANGTLYVSNPEQSVGPGEPNTWQAWQGWKADAWYRKFLGRLLETFTPQRAMLLVRDVDVDGELRSAYKNQGTHASVVLPFKWVAGSVLWYVSINFGRAVATDGDDAADVMPAEISDEERQNYVRQARAIYDDPTRCRRLIAELRSAYDSVR